MKKDEGWLLTEPNPEQVVQGLNCLRFPQLGSEREFGRTLLSGYAMETRGTEVRVTAHLSWEARGLENLYQSLLEESLAHMIPSGYHGAVHLTRDLPPRN